MRDGLNKPLSLSLTWLITWHDGTHATVWADSEAEAHIEAAELAIEQDEPMTWEVDKVENVLDLPHGPPPPLDLSGLEDETPAPYGWTSTPTPPTTGTGHGKLTFAPWPRPAA